SSCLHGEGVSTVAENLAAVAAGNVPGRVLLVHCNLPAGAGRLDTDAEKPGLADVLAHDAAPEHAVQATATPGLAYLSAGSAASLAHLFDKPELVVGALNR